MYENTVFHHNVIAFQFLVKWNNKRIFLLSSLILRGSDAKAGYVTALLGLHLGPLKVAECVFSGIKNRQIVFYISTTPNGALLAEGTWQAVQITGRARTLWTVFLDDDWSNKKM